MREKLQKIKLQIAILKAALKGNKKAKIALFILLYLLYCGFVFNARLIYNAFNSLFN